MKLKYTISGSRFFSYEDFVYADFYCIRLSNKIRSCKVYFVLETAKPARDALHISMYFNVLIKALLFTFLSELVPKQHVPLFSMIQVGSIH